MATNTNLNNNIHINSFTKGMNTDTSLDMISNEQYVFGLNIRITGNALLGALIDSNNKEGVVTPVPVGNTVSTSGPVYTRILATASIENVGAVIVKDSSKHWHVYRVDCNNDKLEFNLIFNSTDSDGTDKDRFSVVINKEQLDITKLYIADGVHEIMMINLDCFGDNTYSYYIDKNEDDLISNRLYPNTSLIISEKIYGKLKTQQLQYTYRFYKKHGICSRPAPLTSKIQVIDGNRNRENGNAEDTETTIGFKVKIPYSYGDIFDYVLLYRISYTKPNTDAEINLILDFKISTVDGYININDTGLESLQTLSPEEFAALTDLNIVPLCIEQNLNYLFAANTEDLTVLRLSSNLNINDIVKSYHFISMRVPLHYGYKSGDYTYQDIPNLNDYTLINKDLKIYQLSNADLSELDSGKTITDYLSQHNVYTPNNITYNDLIVSSMFRSLRRDETYRYGIVLYDKYGKRTNTYYIDDITTPTESEYSMTTFDNNCLYARPIGIEFEVVLPDDYTSYQIVRCAKESLYTKNLLQCVLSRPLRQPLADTMEKITETSDTDTSTTTSSNTSSPQYSPYYPQQFLSSDYYRYYSGKSDTYYLGNANNFTNYLLFLLFNPQINVQRTDLSNTLSSKDLKITPISYLYGNNLKQDLSQVTNVGYNWAFSIIGDSSAYDSTEDICLNSRDFTVKSGIDTKYILYIYSANLIIPGRKNKIGSENNEYFSHIKELSAVYKKYKQITGNVFYYYNKYNDVDNTCVDIKNISDVLNPTWEQGWDNIIQDSSNTSLVADGSKLYKGFTSTIGNFSYVNWVCSNLYDLQTGTTDDHTQEDDKDEYYRQSVYNCDRSPASSSSNAVILYACGCQGPGPVCFLMELSDKDENGNDPEQFIKSTLLPNNKLVNGTLLCNIQHSWTKYAGETDSEKQYDIYYGFGNFKTPENESDTTLMVFDGDVYITPCEIVTMFKAYDFQSYYSLMSNQFVYYVPMETVINTYFDYGMNYMNTQNKNLQLEPGDITGVSVLDRPLTQYNLIYSDNNTSNDLYNTESLDEAENTYTQRIHYSELKDNGEAIDSWMDFKSLNYIDADTRWGLITNLLTVKDIIYYWQTQAFGKLSVNERSLVTDNNSNTIQLGQGGVLQRTDYIDTKHGMRDQDFVAINAEGVIYWIDMVNKAIIQSDGQRVLSYSEIANVLNIVNRSIDTSHRPCIDYDILNNELLCTMRDGMQLVFNIKLNCATSMYTRAYDDIIYFNNIIYGIKNNTYTQYNYLGTTLSGYLRPTELSFCINPNSSTTKVFDDQEVVTLNRGSFISDNSFLENKVYTFNTNLYTDIKIQPEGSTDREGNVRYAIPRTENEEYGNRMRGKWLQVDIVDNNPRYEQSISHVLTKFRQSFS